MAGALKPAGGLLEPVVGLGAGEAAGLLVVGGLLVGAGFWLAWRLLRG